MYAQGLQLNVDLEFLLDRTRDILDYSFIIKHFNHKFKNKYVDLAAIKTAPLQDIDEPLNASA